MKLKISIPPNEWMYANLLNGSAPNEFLKLMVATMNKLQKEKKGNFQAAIEILEETIDKMLLKGV